MTRPVLLRASEPSTVSADLAWALRGGPPVAPLPPDPVERRRALTALQLAVPVTEVDPAAVVTTSGSTGSPKAVVLSRAAVRAAVTAAHDRLGGPGDWVLALPAHYVAGLMVLARCAVAGTRAHRVGTDLTGLAGVAAAMSGRRYVSLVPTQLARAVTDPALAGTLATFDAVLVGGGPINPADADAAARAGIPVVLTYGMSETCGGCVYDGRPLTGVAVELEPGTGRILLRGPMLFSGYRLDPHRTAEASRAGRFLTDDRGRWSNGQLVVLGRIDDLVVTGGRKVDLAEVERLAHDWPDLADDADIAVVGLPDREWGTVVVAVTDGPGLLAGLRQYLAARLPSFAIPRRLVRVSALPRTSSGKVDRRRLVAELAVGQDTP